MLGVTGDEELDVADFPILKCNCQNVAYVSLISNVIGQFYDREATSG